MESTIRIVRNRDLEAFWGVLRAKESGFMRSLITWMGGPEGYINTNPGIAIESRHCAVGLMDMGPGQRQPGVHTHTMTEIYVILEGVVESFDGVGNRHIAGELDCLYIPKGVPHGVRTIGDKPVKLLWINDNIEKWGVSLYQEGPGPFPADHEVSLIAFPSLERNWSAGQVSTPGFMHWNVSWVGDASTGPNYNPNHAARNDRVGVSLSVIQPGNRLSVSTAASHQIYVVVRGQLIVDTGPQQGEMLSPQDAVFCPAGMSLDLRSLDDEPLHLVRVHERVGKPL